jgi:phage host-nuclease inhibitor protein Gam
MAKAAKKLKSDATEGVLQSRDAVVNAIAKIGEHQRKQTKIEASMNDELAGIKGQFEGLAAPHAKAIKVLSKGVQAWCEANRDDLTDGGKVKTAALETGKVLWRLPPEKVVIKGEEAVLEVLATRGLTQFLRTKVEPNKEAMLNEKDLAKGVPGISFQQVEQFVIEPFDVALSEVAS